MRGVVVFEADDVVGDVVDYLSDAEGDGDQSYGDGDGHEGETLPSVERDGDDVDLEDKRDLQPNENEELEDSRCDGGRFGAGANKGVVVSEAGVGRVPRVGVEEAEKDRGDDAEQEGERVEPEDRQAALFGFGKDEKHGKNC